MAEEYKRQTQYAPQIRVVDQSGGRAISRALGEAAALERDSEAKLVQSIAGVGKEVDKARAKSAVDDFAVEFEEVEIQDDDGKIQNIKRPKPINRPLFFTDEAVKLFDRFAISKAKAQIGLELDKEAMNIANKIKYDIGGTSDDFNGLMTPIVEAYAEQLPSTYKPILDITMQEIQAQHSNSIDAYHQKLQVEKNSAEAEEMDNMFAQKIGLALQSNSYNKAKQYILEQTNNLETMEKTSPYGAKFAKRNLEANKSLLTFYEKYGNLINPMDLNGQTVKGQKAYLHNMIAMQSLLKGQPVKFYSNADAKEPDMTITLEQFNNDLGELRPSTIKAFNKHITGRVAALNALIEDDESSLFASQLSALTPNQVQESTYNSSALESLFNGKPSNQIKGLKTIEKIIQNNDPSFTLNGNYDFDPTNVMHLRMFEKVGFFPNVYKKRIDKEIFQNRNLQVLETIINRDVSMGVEDNTFRRLDLSENALKFIDKVDALTNIGIPLDATVFDLPTVEERLKQLSTATGEKLPLIKQRAKEAAEKAIFDVDGITNRFGLGIAEGRFGGNLIEDDAFSQSIINDIKTATFVSAKIRPDASLSDLKEIAKDTLIRFAGTGQIGVSKYTKPLFGPNSGDTTKSQLVKYPIENHKLIDPNTGETTTKHIDALMYRAYLDTVPKGEKPRKWKDIKDVIYVIPLSEQGRFTSPESPLLERYTVHMIDDTGINGGLSLTGIGQDGPLIINPFNVFRKLKDNEVASDDANNAIMGTSTRNKYEYSDLSIEQKVEVAERINMGGALREQIETFNDFVSVLNE
jgi:hypothetical protein